MPTARSQAFSLGLHTAAVALLLLLTTHSVFLPPPVAAPHGVTPLASLHRIFWRPTEQHLGGGNRTLLPARRGALPPTSHRPFIAPVSLTEPKLPMPMSVEFPSPTIEISASKIGDPFSNYAGAGLGLHGDNSIGGARCCGVGDDDHGPPGISGRSHGGSVTQPQLVHQVEPEFSEEARKAKFSGEVVLAIEVDTNGLPRGFRVLQNPGLGLDRKAIEAVSKWRFRPGLQDGKPVVTAAVVHVNFRLL